MASDYQAISVYNEEQLGKDRASRKSQVAMYTDPVHFIFELLQNADDAYATKISFTVTPDQLIIEHNGKPFTESNVKAISYFEKSDKTESGEEITKIGHFGLGFKSVFAYTASPHVYSGQENFKITQLYSVEAVPYPTGLKETQTRFVLPFDHLSEKPDYIENRKLKSPEIAYQDIAGKLAKLGADMLLFTKYLQEIEWATQDDTRHFRRDTISIKDRTREVCINNGASEQRCYLVFDRPIYWPDDKRIEKQHRPVQIAFGLDKPRKDGGAIIKINNAQLFVFFPTAKETHVGFILQGPYRTNPPRENVFPDDEFNQHLVNQTAELLTESLHQLKELDLLNLDTLSVLPLDKDKFEEGMFLEPLYLQVCDILRTSQLLPKHQGGFASANESRLARGAKLAEVFDADQLGKLFGKEKLEWLDISLTINNYPDLHRFLTELVDGIEANPDTLAPKLTNEFFSKQSSDWLIKFIQYAEKSTDKIKQCRFIRLESGEQVALRLDDEKPTAWFAPENSTGLDLIKDFPLVHHKLAENEEVRKFLDKEGIHKIKSVDIVEQCILPKYQDTPFDVDTPFCEYEKAYRADLYQISKAYADADDEIKEGLNESLNDIEWLACIHASGNEPDKVFWKTPESANLYAKPTEKLGFTVPEDKTAYFLHPVVSETLGEFKSINDYLNESIQLIAPLTIVKDFILPNYKTPSEFDEVCYRRDLQWICKAFSGDDSVKTQLKRSLSLFTWLACIHASGKEPEKIIWKHPKSDDLFTNPSEEQIFRVPENMNGYFLHPSIIEEFNQNESPRLYLETCLKEMNAVAIVEKFILPKYTKYTSQQVLTEFDEAGYRSDLQWIYKAYKSNKYQISNKLKSSSWLACVHASGQKPEQIFWKRPNATEEERPRDYSYSPYQSYYQALSDYEAWNKSSNLFKQTDDHIIWFADLKDVEAYFLYSVTNGEFTDEIIDNLLRPKNKLTENLVSKECNVELSQGQVPSQYTPQRGDKYFFGLKGFNPNVSIYGLEQALKAWSMNKFGVLWDLLLQDPRIIKGEISSGTNKKNVPYEKSQSIDSNVGKLCRRNKWLPDKEGNWHMPSVLLLTDLPDEFDTSSLYAKDIAEKLGMKKPVDLAPMASAYGLTQEEIELRMRISTEDFNQFQQWQTSQKHQFDLPDRTSHKPEQRAQKTFEIAESEPEKTQSTRQRTETDGYQPAQGDARVYLLGEYEENGILCCQICQQKQPIIKVHEEYVFDARDCITGINGFHKANNLCLCPNHSRMFTAAKLSEETLREAIRNTDANVATDQRKIPLDLGGNQVEIYFTKNHLADLQAVLKAVFEID